MTRYDDGGNPYDPDTCPCCQGEDSFQTSDLCGACIVAGLAGTYPHDCDHEIHCQNHGGQP